MPARFLSILLSVSLLLGVAPVRAFAQEGLLAPSEQTTASQTSQIAQSTSAQGSSLEKEPRVVRKLEDKTTPYSETFLMSDGSLQMVLGQNLENYQDEEGRWQRIDTTLKRAADGTLSPTSLEEDLSFSRQKTALSPVTLQGEDYSLTLNMLGACEGTPQSDNNTSIYRDVAQDTDLYYDVLRAGIKETLFLKSASAPTEFSFNMRLSGLISKETSQGLALFKPGEKEPLYTFGDLIVFDSSKNDADEPSFDRLAQMTYEKTPAGLTFTYRISKEWLSSPERVFPVQVDPSLTKNASDTFISSAFPKTNYATANELKVGRYDASTGYNRALLRFGVSEIPQSAYIRSATLRLWQTHTYYTNAATTAYLGLVKKSWTSDNTWSTLGCSKGDSNLFSAYRSKSYAGRGVRVEFDVASAVRNWVNKGAANYGFCLYQSEGAASQEPECWRKFASANASEDHKPKLVINYTPTALGGVTFARSAAASPNQTLSYPTFNYREEIAFSTSFTSNYQDALSSVRALVNETQKDLYLRQGHVAWFRDAPDASKWEYYALPAARGGGYIARSLNASVGSAYMTLVPDKCSTTLSGSGESQKRVVNFVVKVTDAFDPAIPTHIDTYASMDNGWETPYKNSGGRFGIVPARSDNAVTSVSTSASAAYFKQKSTYGADDPQNYNKTRDAGRGSIDLTWKKNPHATGYKITFFDGYLYREVADIPSADITSWSSKDSGMYPADERFKPSIPDKATQSDLLSGAKTPYEAPENIETKSQEVSLGEGNENTGLVASDGEHLYFHTYKAGVLQKSSVYVTNQNGQNPQKLDYALPQGTNALVSLNNTLYSSLLKDASTLTGVRISGHDGEALSEKVSYLRMDKPFKTPLGSLAQAGSNIFLAANENYIANAYVEGARLGVRLFKDDGTYVGDKMLTHLPVGTLLSCTLDAQNTLTLVEGAMTLKVTKVALDPESPATAARLITRYTWNKGQAPLGAFTYDAKSNTFLAGSSQGNKFYRFSGPGFDLSDNPNALYRAVKNLYQSNYYNENTNYAFTVVPYNATGRDNYDYDVNATRVAVLAGRSAFVADNTLASETDEQSVLGFQKSISLPTGSLKLSRTLATSNSFGPESDIALIFDSKLPTTLTGPFGRAALRLSVEESILPNATNTALTYTDKDRTKHVFSPTDSTKSRFIAAAGSDEYIDVVGETYALTTAERHTLVFDKEGRITSEADRNGNTTTYTYQAGRLSTIALAGGQEFRFAYSPSGLLTALTGPLVSLTFEHSARTVTLRDQNSLASARFEFDAAGKLAALVNEANERFVPTLSEDGTLKAEYFQETYLGPHLRAATFELSDTGEPLQRALLTKRAQGSRRTIFDALGQVSALSHYTTKEVTSATNALFEEVPHTFYTYDRAGNVISEINASSARAAEEQDSAQSWVYDARGNETRHISALGRITKSAYNNANDLVRQVDPSGLVTWSTYDARGNVVQTRKLINDSGDKTLSEYTYAKRGRINGALISERSLISARDHTYKVTEYSAFNEISGKAGVTTHKDIDLGSGTLLDVCARTTFDEFGRTIKEEDALGAATLSAYDKAGRTARTVDARGKASVSVYDSAGNVTESYDLAEGVRRNWVKTTFNMFRESILEQRLDEKGAEIARTESLYDAAGNLISSDDTLVAGASKSTFDAEGNELAQEQEGLVAGAKGIGKEAAQGDATAQMTYDALGNITSTKEVGQHAISSATYSAEGELTSEVRADGSLEESLYDQESGDLNEVVEFEGEEAEGSEERAGVAERYDFDKGGNLEEVFAPDAAQATYTYDLLGNQLSAHIPGSKESTTTYNALGWPLKIVETYAQSSKIGAPQKPLTLTTKYCYDACGRVLKRSVAGNITESRYNAAGDLIAQTNPDGSTLENTYDAFGANVRHIEQATDSSLAHDITYTYDSQGRVLRATDSAPLSVSSETTYTTFASTENTSTKGEISVVTTLLPHFTLRTHTNTSSQFERASLMNVASATTTSTVTTSTDATSTSPVPSSESSASLSIGVAKRDGAGRVLALASPLLPAPLTRTYDEAGRLSTQSISASETQTYTYLKNSSKLSGWNTLTGSDTFTYDLTTGRLSSSSKGSYTYEKDTALVLPAYAKSTPATGTALPAPQDYDFNARGQRTRSRSASQSAQLTWAGERLSSYETSNTRADYVYDASGMRIKTRTTNKHTHKTTETRSIYEGLRLLELSATGEKNFTLGYLYEEGVSTPVLGSYSTSRAAASDASTDTASTPATGTANTPATGTANTSTAQESRITQAFALESNVRGDVMALRDSAGNVFATYTYDDYGKVTSVTSSATELIDKALAQEIATNQPLRYAGYVYDEASEMYYCAARYYDPATQIFISLDPVRADGERSGYLYCSGDPVNNVDPSGLKYNTPYPTLRKAAINFGMIYNKRSINENREYATVILTKKKRGSRRFWYYIKPNKGNSTGAKLPVQVFSKHLAAMIHSHGAYYPKYNYGNEVFSKTDIKTARSNKSLSYLSTPAGKLKLYNFKTRKVSLIYSKLPYDPKDPFR